MEVGSDAERIIGEEQAAAERLAARVRLGLVAALLAIQLALLVTGEDLADSLVGLVAGGFAMAYGLGVLLWLRRGFRHAIAYVGLTLDLVLVTGVTIASGILPNQVAATTKSPYSVLFFLIVATAGLRQSRGLVVFATVLATACYLSIFAVAVVLVPGSLTSCLGCDFTTAQVSPVRVATFVALLAAAGGVTSVTAQRARDLVRRAVDASVRRQTLLTAMERYFPEREALQMIADGQELPRGGERRPVTILNSDIRGFTSISEQLEPDRVVGLLNDYFEAMVGEVFAEEGTLISFVGDGLWAVFGLPQARDDDAQRAFRAGRRMLERMRTLNLEPVFAAVGGLRIGIAIHTGEVLVGSIGSSQRVDYTVIGDAVNTCARIEELNKTFGTELLISEAAAAAAGYRGELRDRGRIQLRGKELELRVFEFEAAGVRS